MTAPAGKSHFSAADAVRRLRLDVSGAVQGVGFRPFAVRLATAMGLGGTVRNTGAGARIEIEGPDAAVAGFVGRLGDELPLPGRVDAIRQSEIAVRGERDFNSVSSDGHGGGATVLPDLATCPECVKEMKDPANRRHGYAFITCTHCGPRFSVIEAVPYDRANTSMIDFPLCAACAAEYADPTSRRFHAETISCPDCGPQLELWDGGGEKIAEKSAALDRAVAALRAGKIVALKGLGGFQLLCDAGNEDAVSRLRRRKQRPRKPFALMVGDLKAVKSLAKVSKVEAELLQSPAMPIALLQKRSEAQGIAPSVAPENPLLGLVLPATPLHHLLADAARIALVATSGNVSGGVLVADEADAVATLGGIADLFLVHNRTIVHPVDDSVMRVIAGEAVTLRAARGVAPVIVNVPAKEIVAYGGHQKSAIAIGNDNHLVLGPHIGDLDTRMTRQALRQAIDDLPRLYRAKPERIAADRHPDYFSTRLAGEQDLPLSPVPHHLAHVLSCMAENGLNGPVLGIAFDGSGYGDDGTIWGGEFLSVGDKSWRRSGHLLPFRMPGGDAAVREPRRCALGVLDALEAGSATDRQINPALAAFSGVELGPIGQILKSGINAPLTSSAGRLFDAVAALLGLREGPCFEGEAAMAVEFAAMQAKKVHPLPAMEIGETDAGSVVDWRPTIAALIDAQAQGGQPDALALGFHVALAGAMVEMARRAEIETVVLTGGCFQNALLTELAVDGLSKAGFRVYRHHHVPPNDGGLAVGQAVFAARGFRQEQG